VAASAGATVLTERDGEFEYSRFTDNHVWIRASSASLRVIALVAPPSSVALSVAYAYRDRVKAGRRGVAAEEAARAKCRSRAASDVCLIRNALIVRTTSRQGIPDAVQDIYVKHKTGRTSWLTLKSYDQKRLSFQGTGKHVIWLDEEPDLGVYSECLLRTMTTNGLVMCTFTPMLGLSEVVMNYLPEGRMPS
jgi:phage terminase large subunit-like protein